MNARHLPGLGLALLVSAAPALAQEDTTAPSEVRVTALKHGDAEDVASKLLRVLGAARSGPVHVIADSRTNKVVVVASRADHAQAAALIAELDVAVPDARTRIRVEATVWEVSADDAERLAKSERDEGLDEDALLERLRAGGAPILADAAATTFSGTRLEFGTTQRVPFTTTVAREGVSAEQVQFLSLGTSLRITPLAAGPGAFRIQLSVESSVVDDRAQGVAELPGTRSTRCSGELAAAGGELTLLRTPSSGDPKAPRSWLYVFVRATPQ